MWSHGGADVRRHVKNKVTTDRQQKLEFLEIFTKGDVFNMFGDRELRRRHISDFGEVV